MPLNTVTHRQWQNKSVALQRNSDNPTTNVWEFHCDDCSYQVVTVTEQEALDLVASHHCAS